MIKFEVNTVGLQERVKLVMNHYLPYLHPGQEKPNVLERYDFS